MEWRPVIGYEGLYEVSDTGIIRSITRRGTYSNPYYLHISTSRLGYKLVGLCKDGKQRPVWVHRIVAQAFIQNPNNYKEINHKDENPSNNCVENLEWCDRSYNINYGNRTQKTRKPVDMLDSYGNFIKRFEGLGIAAIETSGKKTNQSSIKRCCDGKRKTAIGYKWRWSK